MENKYQQLCIKESDMEIECNISFLGGGKFSTDYFDSQLSKKGVPLLVYINETCFLLMPKACDFYQYVSAMDIDLSLISAGILNVDRLKPRPALQVDLIASNKQACIVSLPNATVKDIPWDLGLYGMFGLVVMFEGVDSLIVDCMFQHVEFLPYNEGATKETINRLEFIEKLNRDNKKNDRNH